MFSMGFKCKHSEELPCLVCRLFLMYNFIFFLNFTYYVCCEEFGFLANINIFKNDSHPPFLDPQTFIKMAGH